MSHFLPSVVASIGRFVMLTASVKSLWTMLLQAMNKRKTKPNYSQRDGLMAALIRNEFFPRKETPPEENSSKRFPKGYLLACKNFDSSQYIPSFLNFSIINTRGISARAAELRSG